MDHVRLRTPTGEHLAAAGVGERELEFRIFISQHWERAVRLAWRLCGEMAAAEDVAQEAFMKAHAALHRLDSDRAIAPWFYTILVRHARNHRRWWSVRLRFRATTKTEPDDLASPNRVADPVLRQRIITALDKLSRKQREVFVLVHLERFTLTEAAAILGCATGTAKSHLHRALKALREELADCLGEDQEAHRDA